jgi:hypothetical protein
MELYGKILIAGAVAVICYAAISPPRLPTDEMRAYVKEANDNAATEVNKDGLRISYMVPDKEAGTLVVICTTEEICQDAYRGFAEEDSLIETTYRAVVVGLPGARNQPSTSAVAWKAGFRLVDFELKTDDGWKVGFRNLRYLSLHQPKDE